MLAGSVGHQWLRHLRGIPRRTLRQYGLGRRWADAARIAAVVHAAAVTLEQHAVAAGLSAAA